jgi:hypothetical protein
MINFRKAEEEYSAQQPAQTFIADMCKSCGNIEFEMADYCRPS